MIEPKMGTRREPPALSIADALFPRVRQRVLAILYGNPSRSFFTREVVALAQSGTGAVQRELKDLTSAGLLLTKEQGNQKHFQANTSAPVYEELRTIVLKTSGLVDVLTSCLAPLAGGIDAAFVYGSIAKRQEHAGSDVDLMVVTDTVGYAELFTLLENAGTQLGRAVNPTVYTRKEFARRMRQGNAFVTRVVEQEKLWVIGSEEQLLAFAS
jgi:predicted nucleotidyltransferase